MSTSFCLLCSQEFHTQMQYGVLTCIIYVLCGLSGFWLHDSAPVYLAVSKLIMILGGAWVPIAFFPRWLQLIAEYSPFGASTALSYAMYPNFSTHFLPIILNICFWTVVGTIIIYIVSKRAMQKLSING